MGGEVILLGHGSGGTLGHELVRRIFLTHLGNPLLNQLEDATLLEVPLAALAAGARLAFTTDSYVVRPLFFPGGDIGRLAVCGTVNDLAMRGALPLALSAGFILEEGLAVDELERVVASMAATARAAGVAIVTGDTKVVERGAADRLFINTAGLGLVPPGVHISAGAARPGDAILLSGAIGDHGLAVMTQREGLRLEGALQSDCAPLHGLVQAMLAASREVHVLRDPTRGGLATALNEIAAQSRVGVEIDETRVPVHPEVAAASELLGLDPLYVANEGKLVAFVPAPQAECVLAAMRAHPYGREAALVGAAVAEHPGRVALRTLLGTRRLLGMLAGEQLPRIC
ncbi:MAG: hydrogenase expression/formation protein HypE [Chloroflexota bacterium]